MGRCDRNVLTEAVQLVHVKHAFNGLAPALVLAPAVGHAVEELAFIFELLEVFDESLRT